MYRRPRGGSTRRTRWSRHICAGRTRDEKSDKKMTRMRRIRDAYLEHVAAQHPRRGDRRNDTGTVARDARATGPSILRSPSATRESVVDRAAVEELAIHRE